MDTRAGLGSTCHKQRLEKESTGRGGLIYGELMNINFYPLVAV